MASNVTTEEARAILDLLRPKADGYSSTSSVVARRFDQPQSLSAAELDALRAKLRAVLPDVKRDLGLTLRSALDIELVEIAEVNAEGLGADFTPPFAALRFEVAGEPGWLVWDCSSALAALELALGASAASPAPPREITAVERNVLARWLGAVVARVARAISVEATNFSVAQNLDELGTWRAGGAKSDSRRLHLHFALSGALGDGAWRLYLPGVLSTRAANAPHTPEAALPRHLADVDVELQVRLGASEIPLAQLLALEVGDVIPLGVEVGSEVNVLVEGEPCVRAVLGRAQENLAVRVTTVAHETDESRS